MSGVLRTGVHGYSGPGVIPTSSMGGGAATAGYFQKVLATGPLVYFPQWEAAGIVSDELVNSWDGAYTGVTLGQPGIGDGNTSPWFDGVNDLNNIWTAALVAAFNSGEMTLMVWAQVNAVGVWTDGSFRHVISITVDVNNLTWIRRANINNRLGYEYRAGGVASTVNLNGVAAVDWMHLAITCSVSAPPTGEVRAYFNGVQTGATQVGLGAWAGLPIATHTLIGAYNTTPSNIWHGWLAHGAVWTRALAPGEIANLAVI